MGSNPVRITNYQLPVMGKIRVGNKINSYLNGEWGSHVRKDGKTYTSGVRRMEDDKIVRLELEEVPNYYADDIHYPGSPWYELGDRCCESIGWENPVDYLGYPKFKPLKTLAEVKKIRRKSIDRKRMRTKLRQRPKYLYDSSYYSKFSQARTHKLKDYRYEQLRNLFKKAA